MAVDFSSSGLAFFVLTTVFVVICGIFMVLRFVSMRISRRRFYLDDGYILFAYVSRTLVLRCPTCLTTSKIHVSTFTDSSIYAGKRGSSWRSWHMVIS